jgi:hypothetical protein
VKFCLFYNIYIVSVRVHFIIIIIIESSMRNFIEAFAKIRFMIILVGLFKIFGLRIQNI